MNVFSFIHTRQRKQIYKQNLYIQDKDIQDFSQLFVIIMKNFIVLFLYIVLIFLTISSVKEIPRNKITESKGPLVFKEFRYTMPNYSQERC